MTGKVIRFPTTEWLRHRNRLGKQVIPCFVSGRYLRFSDMADTGTNGRAVAVDVMSESDDEKPDRKLCELVLTLDDLKRMVARLDGMQPIED
jgi:hypothetical protein